MHADFGLQVYSDSSDTLVQLASGLSEQCVSRISALDLRLSRVHWGVAAMGQDCNYQLGRKKFKIKSLHSNNKCACVLA